MARGRQIRLRVTRGGLERVPLYTFRFYLDICLKEEQETELFRGVAGFPTKSGRITSLEN